MMGRRNTNLLLDAAAKSASEKAVRASATVRFGTVVAVDTEARTIDVQLGDTTVRAIPCMASYADPAVDDVAWLLHQDSLVIAIGKR